MIRDVCRAEGLVLDPVYTGKAFFALRATLQRDPRALGERVVFLHTGGDLWAVPQGRRAAAASMKAASKTRTEYVCEACGASAPKWTGRCGACNQWNSMREQVVSGAAVARQKKEAAHAEAAGGPLRSQQIVAVDPAVARRRGTAAGSARSTACSAAAWWRARWCCSAAIPASASRRCAAGARGAGTGRGGTGEVLYVTGEESVAQTALRARRLGVKAPGLRVLAETALERSSTRRSR